MVETKRVIESSDENVEAAVQAGLAQLGVGREAVEVEVLDEGSRGLLGFGARPARVRLTYVELPAPPPSPEAEPPTATRLSPESVETELAATEPEVEAEPEPAIQQAQVKPDAEADALEIARQTLEELLDKMYIQAQVQAQTRPPEEEDDLPRHVLDIHGPDLGMLIGRRGETLDALQYLTRLIIGRELERRISLTVDVEGYRARRERTLRQLARRMAERTVTTGRKSVLEPMPPAERRIVHMALRNHPDVTTESVGQGDKRKVTIILKKQKH